MCRKFLYGSAIFAFFYFASCAHASPYFFTWHPFTVRDNLVLEKSKNKTAASITQEVLEKYLAGARDYGTIDETKEEKKEEKWDEFQYGSFYLRLSRYHDWTSSKDVPNLGDEHSLWETIKSFSSKWEGAPNRDTLEAMGRIFTPEFNLGIEF